MKRDKQDLFIALIYITAALIILNILKEVFGLDTSQVPRQRSRPMGHSSKEHSKVSNTSFRKWPIGEIRNGI